MDGTMDWEPEDGIEQPETINNDPVDWITTEELDRELFNAIIADSSASSDEECDDFEEVDDYLGGDEGHEDEAEQRRSTLRLLATLRPQLAELLGAPPAD
jgi:hypothetical protein